MFSLNVSCLCEMSVGGGVWQSGPDRGVLAAEERKEFSRELVCGGIRLRK